MLSQFSLLPARSSSLHSLLEPPSPAFTTVTVRRAFIVWLHSGQQNEFRHVCNYFHQLESMEEKLPAEDRATSRVHEFNLLTSLPPSSNFLTKHFPKLYRHNTKVSKVNIKELQEITLEDCVFNLEGFHDLKILKCAKTKDIIRTSQMIRFFCKSHSKSLRTLLSEFQNFAKKTEATSSVDNIAMYIKKKYLRDELVTWSNMPKSFSFLDELEDTNIVNDTITTGTEVLKEDQTHFITADDKSSMITGDDQSPFITVEDHTFNANKNANKIKILINESRRKELQNISSNCQNVLTAKMTNMQEVKPGDVL